MALGPCGYKRRGLTQLQRKYDIAGLRDEQLERESNLWFMVWEEKFVHGGPS